MNQQEFLSALREELQGRIPEEELSSRLKYYEDYFKERVEKGIGEAEILRGLGEPAFVARSILSSLGEEGRRIMRSEVPEWDTSEGSGVSFTETKSPAYWGSRVISAVQFLLFLCFFFFRHGRKNMSMMWTVFGIIFVLGIVNQILIRRRR